METREQLMREKIGKQERKVILTCEYHQWKHKRERELRGEGEKVNPNGEKNFKFTNQ